MIDLHCHILPGVDDGAQTIEDSLDMARYAVKQGITHILCTPHHNNGKYINPKSEIIEKVAELQDVLDEHQIPLTVLEGQEVRLTTLLMDDLAKLPKYSALDDGLKGGLEAKISFLLISNSLQSVQELYGAERLEKIISAATFKLMTAANNKNLSKELEELAGLATKSVQIPKVGNRGILNLRHGLSDGSYYRRIAKALNNHREDEQFRRGDSLLLAEGFYHRPIRAQAEFFLNNPNMIEKSALKPKCFVALETWRKRNPQDLNPPLLIEVLKNSGIKIDKGEDVDAFIAKAFEKAEEFKAQIPDKTSVLTEEITSKWSSRKVKFETEKLQELMNENSDDWWMTEKSFELPQNEGKDDLSPVDEQKMSLEQTTVEEQIGEESEHEPQPLELDKKYVVNNPDDI